MKSPKHSALVNLLRSPSMVGGLHRFSPDTAVVALTLCEDLPAKPVSNRLMLNEVWESEYHPIIHKAVYAIREEVYVDTAMVEELCRRIMQYRSWAHKRNFFTSSYYADKLEALARVTENGELGAFAVSEMLFRHILSINESEREVAVISGRTASMLRGLQRDVDNLPFPEGARRPAIQTAKEIARQLLEHEADWWQCIERFSNALSDPARTLFTEAIGNWETTDMAVIDETYKRLQTLTEGQAPQAQRGAISLEAFYGL